MRGGYGITYVPSNTGFNDGPGFYGAASFTPSVTGNAYGSSPAGVVIAPFSRSAVNPTVARGGPTTQDPRIYGGARRFPYDYKNGCVQQWNFFVEQKLGASWIASAGYIGSKGSRLQVVFIPINSAQLVDPQLLDSWRSTYIASNGSTNPSAQLVQNPWQPVTGPLIPYGAGAIRARSISRLDAAFPYPLSG